MRPAAALPNGKATLLYCTDPICSYCWGMEPLLERLCALYGHLFEWHTLMGGMLKQWAGFADAANGIRAASDVTAHWRDVGARFHMPIDGSLWQRDPVASSWPAARMYLVVRQHRPDMAHAFLRRLRESLMVFDCNIANDDVLRTLACGMGLDGDALLRQACSPAAQRMLDAHRAHIAQLRVRGFPTVVMLGARGGMLSLCGARPWAHYVQALQQLSGSHTPLIPAAPPALDKWLARQPHIFFQEIAVMYDLPLHAVPDLIATHLQAQRYKIENAVGQLYISAT